jgi:hypothetical protein
MAGAGGKTLQKLKGFRPGYLSMARTALRDALDLVDSVIAGHPTVGQMAMLIAMKLKMQGEVSTGFGRNGPGQDPKRPVAHPRPCNMRRSSRYPCRNRSGQAEAGRVAGIPQQRISKALTVIEHTPTLALPNPIEARLMQRMASDHDPRLSQSVRPQRCSNNNRRYALQ